VAALSLYLGILVWCLLRLKTLRSCATRSSHQLVVHGFCLAATVLRLVYLLDEALMIYNEPQNGIWEKLLGISYSSFFPLSAAAFLCVCQFWLRLMYIVDENVYCPWCRNRIPMVWVVFLVLEFLHDSWYLLGAEPWLNAIYFLWLALVDVNVALFGVNIARGLYWRLRDLMRSASMADGSSQLFQRTTFCTAAVSVTSACFLILSVVQALIGRFYAWPCLVCFAVGRLLEAIYLVLILVAIGRARDSVTTDSSNLGGSFMSTGRQTPNSFEAFWISSPSRSLAEERVLAQWTDDVLPASTPGGTASWGSHPATPGLRGTGLSLDG